jgi:5-methylcytosine-specific restriction endonuclease McrA
VLKELGRLKIGGYPSKYNVIGTETQYGPTVLLPLGLFWGALGIYALFDANWMAGILLTSVGLVSCLFGIGSTEVEKYGNKEIKCIELYWLDGQKKWVTTMEYRDDYNHFATTQEEIPFEMRIDENQSYKYWCYNETIWKENENYTSDDVKLLVDDKLEKKRLRLEKAGKAKERRENPEIKEDDSRSRRISQEVKDKVWNRDGGKCVECGSNENLEFDHIIPFSKGGANTYRNIQLLCESCNRSKSDNIG